MSYSGAKKKKRQEWQRWSSVSRASLTGSRTQFKPKALKNSIAASNRCGHSMAITNWMEWTQMAFGRSHRMNGSGMCKMWPDGSHHQNHKHHKSQFGGRGLPVFHLSFPFFFAFLVILRRLVRAWVYLCICMFHVRLSGLWRCLVWTSHPK